MSAWKETTARVVSHPVLGRLAAALLRDSIPFYGARILTSSPAVDDRVKARLVVRLYERAELSFVRTHLRHDLDVVELGCSIGVVGSVVLRQLRQGRRLIGVEADPRLQQVAETNFERNTLGADWVLERAAVSYTHNEVQMFAQARDSTGGQLAGPGVGDVRVECVTLSEILRRNNVIDYCLIADIEGAEAEMILQEAAALGACRQMIIELHDTPAMSIGEMRGELLHTHGFRLVAERGPVLVLER